MAKRGTPWNTIHTKWHSWRAPFFDATRYRRDKNGDRHKGQWFARVQVLETGKLKAVPLNAATRPDAVREIRLLAAAEESHYEDTGEAPLTKEGLTVGDALKAWLKTKEVREITRRFYEQDCQSYARLLGKDRLVATVQPTDVRTAIDGWTTPTGKPKPLAGRTKRKHRFALVEFFSWLIREAKVMRHNPAQEMKEPAAWEKAEAKAAATTRKPFTTEEATRLCAAADGEMLAFLVVGIHTGLRRSNLIGNADKRAVLWGDLKDLFKPGHERLYLESDLMKWDSPEPFDVPLHEELAEFLRAKAGSRIPDAGTPVITMTSTELRNEWPALLKRAQIEGHRTPHDLRATAITRWDLFTSSSVSYALEHHSPGGEVRRRYTKPTHDEIRAQLVRVPRLLPARGRTAVAKA